MKMFFFLFLPSYPDCIAHLTFQIIATIRLNDKGFWAKDRYCLFSRLDPLKVPIALLYSLPLLADWDGNLRTFFFFRWKSPCSLVSLSFFKEDHTSDQEHSPQINKWTRKKNLNIFKPSIWALFVIAAIIA